MLREEATLPIKSAPSAPSLFPVPTGFSVGSESKLRRCMAYACASGIRETRVRSCFDRTSTAPLVSTKMPFLSWPSRAFVVSVSADYLSCDIGWLNLDLTRCQPTLGGCAGYLGLAQTFLCGSYARRLCRDVICIYILSLVLPALISSASSLLRNVSLPNPG